MAEPTFGTVLRDARCPHLVGVGGTGMSSLATLLAEMGKSVSGSDLADSPTTRRLAGRGIRLYPAHRAEQVADADVVIYSAAIAPTNPEIAEARRLRLPMMSHAQALGALMATRRGIGVAGTHGKSTTTALIAHVLATAGRDPTLVGGAEALNFDASARLGRGRELVAEADEYDRRFLELRPAIAVITSIETDHLDYFRDLEEIVEAFRSFVAGMPADGLLVTCEDDSTVARTSFSRRRLRYGRSEAADWRLLAHQPRAGGGATIEVTDSRGRSRPYSLLLTGVHNALNALAAIVVADALGVADEAVRQALATFQGTRRRFETKLRRADVWVVDDYAHHPTAIRATLTAAREVHRGEIWAVFQPHTTNRTAMLMDQFASAFGDADHVLVTPIYRPAGRERDEIAVSSAQLVARMGHADARAVDSLDEALDDVLRHIGPGALVITLGAGDVTRLADRLAERLARTDS